MTLPARYVSIIRTIENLHGEDHAHCQNLVFVFVHHAWNGALRRYGAGTREVENYLILQAEGAFDINTVFAGILVLTGFALALDTVVTVVENKLLVWRPAQGETEPL